MNSYLVMCEVSGGRTGHRLAALKDRAGLPRVFADREEAEREAARLQAEMNGNPYRSAAFRYWVEASLYPSLWRQP